MCNRIIHDEIAKEYSYIMCPFCYKPINERKMSKTDFECCDDQDIINEDGKIVCRNCGVLCFYKYFKEYIDFNENKYKLRKKSFYIRKYHIENTINKICDENKIQLKNLERTKIFEIFNKINKVIPKLNQNRKRTISIKYMLKQIFDMLKIEYENIKITKSESTLKFYDEYWGKLMKLINQ